MEMWKSASFGGKHQLAGLINTLIALIIYSFLLPLIHAGAEFNSSPVRIIAPSSNVEILCDILPDYTSIQWIYNSETLSETPGIRIKDDKLVIKRFRPIHEGIYSCIATNNFGIVRNLETKLQGAYLGDFTDKTDIHVNVTVGNVAHIPCPHVESRPPAIYRYQVNGSSLDTISDDYSILPSGSLQIGTVRTKDAGTYRCIVVNPLTAETRQANHLVILNVITPMSNYPSVLQVVPPNEVQIPRGENHTLECVADGAPVPRMSWNKYGGRLPLNRHRLVRGNLELYNVGRLDEGTYICNADNGLHPRHTTVVLVEVTEPPSFITQPSDQIVFKDATVTFRCQGHGSPSVKVEWFHDGDLIENVRGKVSLDDTSLTLYRVNRNDVGYYQCLLTNSLGGATVYASLSLTQNEADMTDVLAANQNPVQNLSPEHEPFHPFITTLPENTTIKIGDSTVLTCGTNQRDMRHGDNFHWLRNSMTLEHLLAGARQSHDAQGGVRDAELRLLPSGSLQIINAQIEDAGMYTCVVWIDGNSDTATAYLSVLPQGTPHTGISGADDYGGEFDIDDILKISDTEDTEDETNTAERSPAEAGQDLTPPSSPEVSKTSDSSVMLKWTVPANDGLPITFFKVQYKEMVSDRARRQWHTVDEDIPANLRQFEMTSLKSGSTYRFRIVGVYSNNDNKHGENSRKVHMKSKPTDEPKGPIAGPDIVVAKPLSDSAIKLTWQYMPEVWIPLEGFTLYYGTYASGVAPQKKTIAGGHVRDIELRNLKPNTIYEIRMKGYNGRGESNFSNTVVMQTLPVDQNEDNSSLSLWPEFFSSLVTMATSPSTTSAVIPVNKNADEGNKTLYIVLGCVLGVMVIFLLFFMGMCAWKQRQRARMLENQNKFQDQSRAIFSQKPQGNGLLLNGIGNGHTGGNGHISHEMAPQQTSLNGQSLDSHPHINPNDYLQPLNRSSSQQHSVERFPPYLYDQEIPTNPHYDEPNSDEYDNDNLYNEIPEDYHTDSLHSHQMAPHVLRNSHQVAPPDYEPMESPVDNNRFNSLSSNGSKSNSRKSPYHVEETFLMENIPFPHRSHDNSGTNTPRNFSSLDRNNLYANHSLERSLPRTTYKYNRSLERVSPHLTNGGSHRNSPQLMKNGYGHHSDYDDSNSERSFKHRNIPARERLAEIIEHTMPVLNGVADYSSDEESEPRLQFDPSETDGAIEYLHQNGDRWLVD